MQVVILAGGLATRLKPLSDTVPKSLISVAGRPFIAWQLEYIARQGLSEVLLCVGHMSEEIMKFVGDGTQFGLSVKYSNENNRRLGTGGALVNAFEFLDECFFILYGDSFLPISFSDVKNSFFNCKRQALMTVYENKNNFDRSNVIYRNGMIENYQKIHVTQDMNYIDYGLSILNKNQFISRKNKICFDLSEVYRELVVKKELAGYVTSQRFYEIGSFKGLAETEDFIIKEWVKIQ